MEKGDAGIASSRDGKDEMVGWHHRLNGCEFEQTLGDSEGQGSLVRCSPWGHRESDMTEQQLSGGKRECIRIVCLYVYVSLPTYTLSFQGKSV